MNSRFLQRTIVRDKSNFGSMASPMTRDTANVSDTNHTKVPRSPLLSLPPELLHKIFAPFLRSGDLAILRTSRQICDEGVGRLYREGVFRLSLGFGWWYHRWDDAADINVENSLFFAQWKKFQNFHFRLDWRATTLQYYC